jgi:hypothetical protein
MAAVWTWIAIVAGAVWLIATGMRFVVIEFNTLWGLYFLSWVAIAVLALSLSLM